MNEIQRVGILNMRVILFSVFLFLGLSVYITYFAEERTPFVGFLALTASIIFLFMYIKVKLRARRFGG